MDYKSREDRIAEVRRAREGKATLKLYTIQENQKLQAGRTPAQQIKRLDFLLGKGCGATKERARLTKLLT